MVEQRSEAASIYPAIQNLLLAARARGLAATMTTWHLIAEADVKQILDIPNDVRTYALVPIGWPLGRFGPVARLASWAPGQGLAPHSRALCRIQQLVIEH